LRYLSILTYFSRYNLKRRVTSLPPITSEVFTEKVIQAQASSNAAATKAAYEKTCTVCERTYFSENAYRNHVGSQKHKAKLAEAGNKKGDDESESMISSTFSLGEPVAGNDEIDSDAEEFNEVVEGIKKTNLKEQSPVTRRSSRPHYSTSPEDDAEGSATTASSVTAAGEQSLDTSLKRCLFCNLDLPSIPANAQHMEKVHGMFIPEKDYLVNLDGLIGSLHEKIHADHECLYCGKLKPSVFGLQTHMRDLGHCKIPFDTEDQQLEIGEFYDFTSTYSDVEDDSDSEGPVKKSGGVKLGAKRPTDTEGDEDMEDGGGWETDSSTDSTETSSRPHKTNKSQSAAFYSDYELHLPTGRTAGHRSLNRYFRQNLHNHPSPAERQEQHILAIEAEGSSDSETGQQVILQGERGRAVAIRSSAGMVGVTDEKRRQVQIAEKKSRKVEERERRRYEWGNNKQSNMQKHFRVNPAAIHDLDVMLTISRILYSSSGRDYSLWHSFAWFVIALDL